MTDVAIVAAQVSPVNETPIETWTLIAGVAITRGQTVAINTTTGLAFVGDASTGVGPNVRGIALNNAGAGDSLTIMVHGSLYGFTLTNQAYDAPIYSSNTAGAVADAAGDVSEVIGRVKPMHDAGTTPTKVLYVNIPAAM